MLLSNVEFERDAADDFEQMPPTSPLTTTSLTTLQDHHTSDSNLIDLTTKERTTTIHWVRDTFAPVFQALDRLEIEITKLSDRLLAAISNVHPVYPPMPPTPNPQPHCHQPQFRCPSPYKRHPRETPSCSAPNHRKRTQTQTIQQQQTHHCHRNHTKHRHVLWSPLPIIHSYFSKYLPLPVHIPLTNYIRYLANNFKPP